MNKNEDQFNEPNSLGEALSQHADQLKQYAEANNKLMDAINKRYGGAPKSE